MGRIQDSPPLTRFVIERKNKVATDPVYKKWRAKAKLFEPYQRKVSVFLTKGWSAQQRVQRGIHVAWEREKKLHGWAILRAAEVPKKICNPYDPINPEELICRLTVEVDNDPPGHANIVGWPEETDDWLTWQEVLAERSNVTLFPSPIEIQPSSS